MAAEAGWHLPGAAGHGVDADVAAGGTASRSLDAQGAFLGRGASVLVIWWDFSGIFMGLSWDFHGDVGIFMGFSWRCWDFHGFKVLRTYFLDWKKMISWRFHGIFMRFIIHIWHSCWISGQNQRLLLIYSRAYVEVNDNPTKTGRFRAIPSSWD